MIDLGHLDATLDEFLARGDDVGRDEFQMPHRARHGRRDTDAEGDRDLTTAGRCHLHDAEVIAAFDVGVDPPAQPVVVELQRLVDVGHREADHFEVDIHDAHSPCTNHRFG